MNRYVIAAITVLMLGPLTARAQRYDRGYDMSHQSCFVKKGSWMVGGTANYSLHDMRDYSFLMIDEISSMGYDLVVSPAFCYMRRDNLGLGMRLEYSRNMSQIDTAGLSVAGMGISFEDYHTIKQQYTAKAILRNYIPLGDSKRFALVNETQLSLGWGQSKMAMRSGPGFDGSYATTSSIGINICPGMMAFADEHFAVEFSVNMLGLMYSKTSHVHNQVSFGSTSATSVNFKINILSIGFGLYYYL